MDNEQQLIRCAHLLNQTIINYLGPQKIMAWVSKVTFHLQLLYGPKFHTVAHVSLLKTFHPDPFQHQPQHLTLVVVQARGILYPAVLDCHIPQGTLQYLIGWAGYNLEDSSWEPVSEVHATSKVWAFQAHQCGKTVTVGVGGGKGRAEDGVRVMQLFA